MKQKYVSAPNAFCFNGSFICILVLSFIIWLIGYLLFDYSKLIWD